MLKYLLLPVALIGSLGASAQGLSCESLRGEIEAKYRRGGINNPELTVVEAATTTAVRGRIVGICERGSKKIVYTPNGSQEGVSAVGAVPRKPASSIITECKDGSVFIGATCVRK